MQRLRWIGSRYVAGFLVGGFGLVGRGLAWEAVATVEAGRRGRSPRPREAQTTVLVPQTQVVYETVQSVECVQVPVTHMQTLLSDGVSHRERAGHADGPGDGQ